MLNSISLHPISKLNSISFYLMMPLLLESLETKQDETHSRASTSQKLTMYLNLQDHKVWPREGWHQQFSDGGLVLPIGG